MDNNRKSLVLLFLFWVALLVFGVGSAALTDWYLAPPAATSSTGDPAYESASDPTPEHPVIRVYPPDTQVVPEDVLTVRVIGGVDDGGSSSTLSVPKPQPCEAIVSLTENNTVREIRIQPNGGLNMPLLDASSLGVVLVCGQFP